MAEKRKTFPGGVWPVILTPFKNTGEIDFSGLKQLTNWYIKKGCSGLFAVCQSSEMFQMTLEERLLAAETVVNEVNGRVPVIACGNISDGLEKQIDEVKQMYAAGVDAVILITNQFAEENEDDVIWMKRCEAFLQQIPHHIPLGLYECPYPYKRLISLENLEKVKETGRFYFLKDTCCEIELIKSRIELLKGSSLQLYNANTTTLLESLQNGAAGFSGVMANFHPELYVYLQGHQTEPGIEYLQAFLALAALIERQYYPVNSKYYLQHYEGLSIDTFCRKMDDKGLTSTFKKEVEMLFEITDLLKKYYIK